MKKILTKILIPVFFFFAGPVSANQIPNVSCDQGDNRCNWTLLSLVPSSRFGNMAALFKRLHLVPDPGVDSYSVPRDWWAKKDGVGNHIRVIFDIGNHPEGCLSGFKASWTQRPGSQKWEPDPMSTTSYLSGKNPEKWVESIIEGCRDQEH